jgi:RND family efflux transporter MFP subunit
VLAALPAFAAAPVTAAKVFGCLIEPDRVADVGTQVIGLVERLAVERGDAVSAGQALVMLRAEVERASAGAAGTRARLDADVLAAQANLELAEQKMNRAQALQVQSFVSEQAVEQARAELELARQRLAQSRSQQRVWADEQRVAEAQLALRTVRSPFDGVVVERFVNLGERVEEKPLMRVAVIDPLRVELMVPTAQYGAVAVGDRITIRPELPGVAPVTATVRHIDRVLDAASNSFRVRLTLPNPQNRLPAGLRCKADLPGNQSAGAPTLAPKDAAGVTPSAKPAAAITPVPKVATAAAPGTKAAVAVEPAPKAAVVVQPAPKAAVAAAPEPKAAVPVALNTKVAVADLPEAKADGSVAPDTQAAVLRALENWRKAWALKDVPGYLSAYVPDFRGNLDNTQAWRQQRQKRISAASRIDVHLSDAKLRELAPGKVQVDFRQTYRSDQLSESRRKSIVLVLERGRWLIEQERVRSGVHRHPRRHVA